MSHPVIMSDDVNTRFQEMLQTAEARRCYRQLKGSAPSLLQRTGNFLITVGQQLKRQAQPTSTTPAFQK